jgi:DNA-binding transcriptional MerR regulator
MHLTVSKICELLVDAPRERPFLKERIRHWARVGLIRSVGDKHPGTGRHREYDGQALVDIVVLNALAEMGLQIASLRAVLSASRALIRKWWYEIMKGNTETVYLEVSNFSSKEATVRELRTQGKYLPRPESISGEVHLLINVTTIIQKIRHATEKSNAENA